jgi:Initiator Replication protein
VPISPEKFPRVPENLSSIVKPEELVDVIETSPLTLHDRRVFNLLLGNAWNRIFNEDTHFISHKELTKYTGSNNHDIIGSLRRLMMAIVQIRIERNHNGEEAIRQVALLGSNEVETRGSEISYSFPPALIKIIRNTEVFARIHTQVMFRLSSKYSLALYEFLQRRKNLRHINYELLTIDEIRGIFGVPPKKLTTFGNLNVKAIKPATEEVSFLSEFEITAEPIRTGRAVTHVKFSWKLKEDIGQKVATVEELERPKLGRKERMQGTVAQVVGTELPESLPATDAPRPLGAILPPLPKANTRPLQVPEDAMERAKTLLREAGARLDIYALESDFLIWAAKSPPDNPGGAFIGFVKKRIAKN